jgi:outer membrane protein assembly factor BamB
MAALIASVFLATWSASAADVAFGHADWKASPTDPVGFAGQGRNWFPGATPPAEWADSTNGTSKNILWKVPIPGWTDAQPVAVNGPSTGSGRGRIVGVYSPHHVVCYDAQTGKVLWKDELKLMMLPALSADRKTVGSDPDPAQAAKLQQVFERMLAQSRIHMATGLFYDDNVHQMLGRIVTERRALIQYVMETLSSWRADLGQQWPEAVAALDKDLEFYRQALDATAHEAFLERTARLRRGHGNFVVWAEQTTGVRALNNWQGSVSDVMAPPVSDGERVYVVLGFGQIAAYELSTGKRLWAFRDPLLIPGTADHNAAPLLWRDLLLVQSPGETRGEGKSSVWHRSIRAYETRTGKLRWESFDQRPSTRFAWGAPKWHGFHTAPCLIRGPQATYVVSGLGHVLNAETGQSVTQLTVNAEIAHSGWGAGFIAATDDRLFKGNAVDNGTPFIEVFPITWRDGVPEFGASVAGPFKPSQGPFAVSDRVYVVPTGAGGIVEVETGKVLHSIPRRGGGLSATIVGELTFLNSGTERSNVPNSKMTDVATLRTQVMGAGREIENVIEAVGYTPDISHTYFPRFGSEKELRKWGALSYGHCNYQGIGFNFATDTAGLTAYGSRLYLHAPAWLYCIGVK